MDGFIRNSLIPLYPRLRRFATILTGSDQDGDDLVQHACERALTRSMQWQPGTRLDRWLYRIMYNVWIDERRSARVRTRAPLDDATEEIGDDGEARAAARLTLDVVYRELRELPEDQRVVLTLICIDGLSYKETAETLGIPLGTVMSRLARARLALADRVDQSGTRSAARIVKLW